MNIKKTYYRYKVYGVNIESEIILPELEELGELEDIDITINYGIMPDKIQDYIKKGKNYKFKKREMWFYIKDVAKYLITNGSSIIVEPEKNAPDIEIKKFILGSCLGMALLQRYTVAIHGGVVVVNDKAIILTGDSGAGKSTLTAAFRIAGYKFMSDDVAATIIDLDRLDYPLVCPGYPRQKLCIDAMESMDYDKENYIKIDKIRNKYSIPTNDSFVQKNMPLGAIIELTSDDCDCVEIEEVNGLDKIEMLMKNIYRIEITKKSGIYDKYLRKCIHIAKQVPFYRLKRPIGRLSVKEQIDIIKSIGVV